VLPTHREIQAFLMTVKKESVEAFAKNYLQTQCGYDGELSVVDDQQLRFRIELPTPLPSVTGNESGALLVKVSFGDETTLFRWKWPDYTPIREVCDEIALLLGVGRCELEFLFPEDYPIIRHYFQLIKARQDALLLVRRKSIAVPLTLVFGARRSQMEFETTDRVTALRAHALDLLSRADETLKIQASDLVLLVGDQVLTDGMQICELRQYVVTITIPSIVKVCFKFETGAEPLLLEQVFSAAATVKDGRDWVSQKIHKPSDKITLFYGGRELRDTQRLSRLRLQPDTFVLIWVDEPNDVLLQSMKCLQIKPKTIHFVCESDNEAFDIEFHGSDLIDAVRVRVAAMFSVDPTQIQLWFADQLLFDDVIIDAIGLGGDSHIRVVVKSAEEVGYLRRLRSSCLFNSLCRFGTFSSTLTASGMAAGPGDLADVPQPNLYEHVSPDELKSIQQVMKTLPACPMSEEEVVTQFLECNRDVELLRTALESACDAADSH
jgi:hypothetical protein